VTNLGFFIGHTMKLKHAKGVDTMDEAQRSIQQRVRARQDSLTKPPGSLGKLEWLAEQLALAQRNETPHSRPGAVLLFAADHPVALHGVSAFPQAVTRAMVLNFVHGGAAASVLCRHLGLPLSVIDVGVAGGAIAELDGHAMYTRAAVAECTEGNVAEGDALTPAVFHSAWEAGADCVNALDASTKVVVLGEMGIGNSVLAGIVAGTVLGLSPAQCLGRGTGVDNAGLARKKVVVEAALKRLTAAAPFEALRRGGGRELVALAAAATCAAKRNMAVLVDGIVVTAAVAAAVRADPNIRGNMIFAHLGDDASHAAMLQALDASPLLDLSMRLGEGSGALTAYPLLDTACVLHNTMATFESAAVPNKM
jgi:nicotinate-nucleotide--dimethylbenzimidazole phosphoribosyltransferase